MRGRGKARPRQRGACPQPLTKGDFHDRHDHRPARIHERSNIAATAPLGAIIRYTDLSPEPPLRFKNKHAAWKRSNAQGRLICVTPGKNNHPGHFTLHEGDFGTANTVVISFRKTFRLDSGLRFAIAELPAAGSVAVLTKWNDIPELQHLAANQQDAADWMRRHQQSGAYLQPIQS